MSLTLVTVASNGGPLNATQNDANMNAIMTEVNSTEATLATTVSTATAAVSNTALNAMFSGTSAGQQLVSWSNVINKPASQTLCPFRITSSGTDQVCSITGGTPFQTTITLNSTVFDPQSVTNPLASTMTAPVNGYYQINCSAQIHYVSGTVSGSIGMNVLLMRNGAEILRTTSDLNQNTGERIWRINELVQLVATDVLTMQILIVQGFSGQWNIVANNNTNLNGFLVLQTS